jgi:hypothetical protein
MLMEKEEPLEKSTPEACRTAFLSKLSLPEGSLCAASAATPDARRAIADAHNLGEIRKGRPGRHVALIQLEPTAGWPSPRCGPSRRSIGAYPPVWCAGAHPCEGEAGTRSSFREPAGGSRGRRWYGSRGG